MIKGSAENIVLFYRLGILVVGQLSALPRICRISVEVSVIKGSTENVVLFRA